MKLSVQVSTEARADIRGIANYIADDSLDAAERFAPAVFATLRGLAEFPGKGSPKYVRVKHLAGLRSFAVDGFPNHLIFYQVGSNQVLRVLGVIHGARNWLRLLRRRQ